MLDNADAIARSHWRAAYEKGRNCLQKGNLPESIAALRKAVQLNDSAAAAFHDLGVALHLSGNFESALASFTRAIELSLDSPQVWFNGGNTLCAMQRFDEALEWFLRAVEYDPGFGSAHYNLAKLYKAMDKPDLAKAAYQRAILADPGIAEAHNNLGVLWMQQGFPARALDCFHRAIRLNQVYVEALYNAGIALNRLGRTGEAIRCVRQCLDARPDHGEALALHVSLLQQLCDWPALHEAQAQLEHLTQRELQSGQRPAESPFLSFTRSQEPERNLEIARRWSNWLIEQSAGRLVKFDFAGRDASAKRLTIGYLSERFRNAATAHLISGMFARHDRRRFRIIAYSWGADDGSIYRRRIEDNADQFVDIRKLSDTQAAQRIHHDKVDILVDLMGWMHGHRMGIAALRPAPVQASFLGYPGTTGASFMDYIVADRVVIPPAHQRFYSEKVVYLPDCYQVNDPDTPIDMTPIARSDCGLPERSTVFCSFNTDYKIEPHLFDAWMNILRAVPHSVLWLLIKAAEARQNLCLAARSCGVDPRRLIFAAPLPKARHLARLRLADLALDTLTVNGHTTTVDALLSGVPVIARLGNHFASRVAGSLLKNLGLDELVVRSINDYQRLAISLGCHADRLSAVKAKLKTNREVYPLFDCDRYVRNLEAAFDQMWRSSIGGGQRCPTRGAP